MEEKNNAEDFGQIHFSWTFSEIPQYQRDRKWYIWGALIAAALLFFSLVTFNLLFALIIIMSAMIIMLFQRQAKSVDFKITEDGIIVNNDFFGYKNLRNFYIIYNPPEVKTLYFEPKSVFNPRIPIYLDEQNPVEVRQVLKQYLEEDLERENEPVSDQISRIFKL
jgi:hypothetical protein